MPTHCSRACLDHPRRYKKGNAKNTGEGSSKLAQSFNGHFEYTGSDLNKMVSSPGSEGANIQLNKVQAS